MRGLVLLMFSLAAALPALDYSLQVQGAGASLASLPLAWRSPGLAIRSVTVTPGDSAGWHEIRVDGRLEGVAVSLAGGRRSGVTFEFGPTPTGTPPMPSDGGASGFVRARRYSCPLTTRPFTAEEMLRLHGFLASQPRLRPMTGLSSAAGRVPTQGNWAHSATRKGAGNHVDTWEWSSGWIVAAPGDYCFGSDQGQVPWTVLVDGRPVANWREATAAGDEFWGASVSLGGGCHSLQFLAVLNRDDPMPRCLWRPAASELPGQEPPDQFTTCPPSRLAVIGPGGDGQSKPSLEIETRLLDGFRQPDGIGWSQWLFRIQRPSDDAAQEERLISRQEAIPAFSVELDKTILEWPAVPCFQPLRRLEGHLQWLSYPVIAGDDAACRVQAVFARQGAGSLAPSLNWHWTHVENTDGDTVPVLEQSSPLNPGEPLALACPADGELQVALEMRGQSVFPPLSLWILEPDSDFSDLGALGNALAWQGRPVCLRRRPPVARAFAGVAPHARLCALFPGDTDDYASALAAVTGQAFQPIAVQQLNGAAPFLRELVSLLAWPDQEDTLLLIDSRWLNGQETAAWDGLLDVLAGHFKKAMPVPVIFPDAPIARQLKRRAVALGLPIIDLHSAALLDGARPDDSSWQATETLRQLEKQGWSKP